MMLLTFTPAPVRRFGFGLHRHKYATSFAPANAFAKTPRSRTHDRGAGNRWTAMLLKRWAIAGAFSLLTLHRDLAQY
jgi:hypothetical protein